MANQNRENKIIIYRPLTESDIGDAIRLHERLIPSAGARMGKPYLEALHKTFITDHRNRLIGAFNGNRLVGFVATTTDLQHLQRKLNWLLILLFPTIVTGILKKHFSLWDLIAHQNVVREVQKYMQPATTYLVIIAVDREFQRKGIATSLIQYIAAAKKPERIVLDTHKTNTKARQFYTKFGFVPVQEVAGSILFIYTPSTFRSAPWRG